MSNFFAYGLGLAHRDEAGTLDVWFAFLGCAERRAPAFEALLHRYATTEVTPLSQALAGQIRATPDAETGHLSDFLSALPAANKTGQDQLLPVIVCLREDAPIKTVEAAYLKLHLLSARLKRPNSMNLDGLFSTLPTLAWTNLGPVRPHRLPALILRERLHARTLQVRSLDKFPAMTDYLAPSGVRIGDAARIRLGAYLGEGATVMHEGFVNFNAGALGPNMIEGRISQGVVVGAHSDLGGSASTMGTLAGGGTVRISIGAQCLIGANAGTGISLGDRCTIEAGLYITAATPVRVLDASGHPAGQVKARELSGQSDLLFLRNGATGSVECRSNRTAIELNKTLHRHN